MVNDTEKMLSAFSEMYFYKEIIQNNLRFTPVGDTEKEVADLILNIGDIVIAIQLKARNETSLTGNRNKEAKWLSKECKEAKKQIKDSISFIRFHDLPAFKNGRGQKVSISSETQIIPLVIFMNDEINDYQHILLKHSEEGMDVNCMSYNDFMVMCKVLLTPMEIARYLVWRLEFYKENASVNFMINEEESGNIVITKPTANESLVYQFLSIEYGIKNAKEIENDIFIFREYLHQLPEPEHTVVESEPNASYPLIIFFAHFDRMEIKAFVERLNIALKKSLNKEKEYEIVGSLRNNQRNYAIVFTASQNGLAIPTQLILEQAEEKGVVDILLQVVVYWESNTEYRIDFRYCDFTIK